MYVTIGRFLGEGRTSFNTNMLFTLYTFRNWKISAEFLNFSMYGSNKKVTKNNIKKDLPYYHFAATTLLFSVVTDSNALWWPGQRGWIKNYIEIKVFFLLFILYSTGKCLTLFYGLWVISISLDRRSAYRQLRSCEVILECILHLPHGASLEFWRWPYIICFWS